LNINTREFLGRTRYRDEYVSDIIVVKYEKTGMFDVTSTRGKKSIPAREIIPDFNQNVSDNIQTPSGFWEAVPLYSVRLMNAFPTNISSIPLSSGASDLVKVQVTFEYETAVTSAHNNGTVRGKIETII
jgi:hypothetical protein